MHACKKEVVGEAGKLFREALADIVDESVELTTERRKLAEEEIESIQCKCVLQGVPQTSHITA